MESPDTLSVTLSRRLVDSLYTEAMVLADEARSYFDQEGIAERDALDTMSRVSFSCESLKVTTRLMHVIAWLLTQRAVHRGEITAVDLNDSRHALGVPSRTDAEMIRNFPFSARALIEASEDLYARVQRLEERMTGSGEFAIPHIASPARGLIDRLHSAF